MRGIIIVYNTKSAKGIISGDDGNRYELTGKDWKLVEPPKVGMYIDFIVTNGRVYDFVIMPSMAPKKTRFEDAIIYTLGWIFTIFATTFFLSIMGALLMAWITNIPETKDTGPTIMPDGTEDCRYYKDINDFKQCLDRNTEKRLGH
jgi:hypothetical protein